MYVVAFDGKLSSKTEVMVEVVNGSKPSRHSPIPPFAGLFPGGPPPPPPIPPGQPNIFNNPPPQLPPQLSNITRLSKVPPLPTQPPPPVSTSAQPNSTSDKPADPGPDYPVSILSMSGKNTQYSEQGYLERYSLFLGKNEEDILSKRSQMRHCD